MLLFKNASIKWKILAMMVVSAIPVLLVLAYFIQSAYTEKHRDVELKVLSAVQVIAFEHSAQVEGVRSLLTTLSEHPEIRRKDPAACTKLLDLILEKNPSGLVLGVADARGKIVATCAKHPAPATGSIAHLKYFKDALKTKRFSSGEFVPTALPYKPTLQFALPVLDAGGEVELVLFAAIDLNSFGKMFDAQNFPRGSIINLTDHQGRVLLRYAQIGLDDQNGKPDREELRRNMTGESEEGIFSGIGLDGVQRQLAYKRVRLAPGDPPYLFIRVSIPEEVAAASAAKAFLLALSFCVIAAVLTYSLTSVIARRYVVNPLKQLVTVSRRVEAGDLDARSGLAYTADEIGQLARSFDEMTCSLKERIVEIRAAESEKHWLANYDSLTGLPNRRLLQDRLNLSLVRSRRQSTGFALLYIDIDNFKHINDSLGHTAGDQLLKVMASRYQAVLREDDAVCRLGGDEFAVILHDIPDEGAMTVVVEKLLEATATPLTIASRPLLVSASIGGALYPKDAQDAVTLEKCADLALYHAKDEGKNTFRMFSEELDHSSHERLSLLHALHYALERNELCLNYQPKICNATGKVIGVEALLRWNNAELGSILPDRFIPIAEESRLIIPIGEWVLRQACAQQVAWKRMGYDLSMAVNLSAVQFKAPNLIETIRAILTETGMEAEKLELELTESCLVDKPDEAIKTLAKIRELNCNIAIDDFGTGYSSLSYLKNFPVSVLKIDRSFVKDLFSDSSDRAIAQSVVNLANNLNMLTVAEGVENSDQQEILKGMGCSYVQGYLHSRPVAPEYIPDIVRSRNS